jgi:hypothetical protein
VGSVTVQDSVNLIWLRSGITQGVARRLSPTLCPTPRAQGRLRIWAATGGRPGNRFTVSYSVRDNSSDGTGPHVDIDSPPIHRVPR